ncbi:hypothetical protein GQ600_18949 [Phytophthora cactorum]|nr:hypothetical protein GQ600_18949 [Phytophthora cactorum]
MGSVEKGYKRLVQPFFYDMIRRQSRLNNLFRLTNGRVRTVETSQGRTTNMYGLEDFATRNVQ